MDREARSFEAVTVPPGRTAEVVARLSVRDGAAFVPSFYVVPDDVAPHFTVCDVLVGQSRQTVAATSPIALRNTGGRDRIRYASSGSVPAALFARSSPFSGGRLRLAHDGAASRPSEAGRVSLVVRNVSGEERVFRGSVVGRRARAGQPQGGGLGVALGLGRAPSSRGQRTRVCAGSEVCFRPTHLYFPKEVLGAIALERVSVVSAEGKVLREATSWEVSRGLVVLEGDLLVCSSDHVVVDFLQTSERPATVEGAVVGYLSGVVDESRSVQEEARCAHQTW